MADSTSLLNRRAPIVDPAKSAALKASRTGGKHGELNPPPPSNEGGAASDGHSPKKPKKGLLSKIPGLSGVNRKLLFLFCGGSFILMVVGASIAFIDYLRTDSGVRSFILPYLSRHLGVEIAARRVEWEPFSSIRITGLRVGPKDKPLLEAEQFFASYDGQQLLKKNYSFKKVTFKTPVLHLEQKGRGEWERIPQALWERFSQLQTELAGDVRLNVQTLEVEGMGLQYSSPHLKFQIMNMSFVTVNVSPGNKIEFDNINGKFNSEFSHARSGMQDPSQKVDGTLSKLVAVLRTNKRMEIDGFNLGITVSDLRGKFHNLVLDGHSIFTVADLNMEKGANDPIQIREGLFTLQKRDEVLFSVGGKGTVDPETRELDLSIKTGHIRKNVLDTLFKSPSLEFKDSYMTYEGHLRRKKGSTSVELDGVWNVELANLGLPEFNLVNFDAELRAASVLSVDWHQRLLDIRELAVDLRRARRPWIKSKLQKPFQVSWFGEEPEVLPTSSIQANLEFFPTDLIPYIKGVAFPAGMQITSAIGDGKAEVMFHPSREDLQVKGQFELKDFAFQSPWIKGSNSELTVDGEIQFKGAQALFIQPTIVKLKREGKTLLLTNFKGSWDLPTGSGGLNLELHASAPDLLRPEATPGLQLTGANLTSVTQFDFKQNGKVQIKTENVINELQFGVGKVNFENAGLEFTGAGEIQDGVLELNQLQTRMLLNRTPAAGISATGRWDLGTDSFTLNYNLDPCEKSILEPTVAAFFPSESLKTASFTSQGKLEGDPRRISWNATNHVKQLAFEGRPSTYKPLDARVITDLVYSSTGMLELKSLTCYLDAPSVVRNLLKISGSAHRKPNGLVATINSSGRLVDLSDYHDQLFPLISSIGGKIGDLDFRWLQQGSDIKLNVVADSLKVKDFQLEDVQAPMRFRKKGFEMFNARSSFRGAPITVTLLSNETKGKPMVHFGARLQDFSLQKLPAPLSLSGKTGMPAEGTISGETVGEARLGSLPEFTKSLSAMFDNVRVRNARLDKIEFFRKSLQQMAAVLQAPELENARLEEAQAAIEFSPRGHRIRQLLIRGPNVFLSMKGSLAQPERVMAEGQLMVRRTLAARSVVLAPLAAQSPAKEWFEVPEPFRVSGTWEDPRLDWNLSKLYTPLSSAPSPGMVPGAAPLTGAAPIPIGTNPLSMNQRIRR